MSRAVPWLSNQTREAGVTSTRSLKRQSTTSRCEYGFETEAKNILSDSPPDPPSSSSPPPSPPNSSSPQPTPTPSPLQQKWEKLLEKLTSINSNNTLDQICSRWKSHNLSTNASSTPSPTMSHHNFAFKNLKKSFGLASPTETLSVKFTKRIRMGVPPALREQVSFIHSVSAPLALPPPNPLPGLVAHQRCLSEVRECEESK